MTPVNSQNQVGDKPASTGGKTRSAVRAMNGMIATSQPLASAAGLRILQQGGNAVDAAVAAAAALCVVEPMMVGPGGDLFAIVWDAKRKELKGLNASGRSPSAISIDELKRRGVERMPSDGIHTVTVPGCGRWVGEDIGSLRDDEIARRSCNPRSNTPSAASRNRRHRRRLADRIES